MIGDVLSITVEDLQALLFVVVLVLAGWAVIFNRLLLLSINSAFARSRGVSTFGWKVFLLPCWPVVVSIGIQWVGILIINALLVFCRPPLPVMSLTA